MGSILGRVWNLGCTVRLPGANYDHSYLYCVTLGKFFNIFSLFLQYQFRTIYLTVTTENVINVVKTVEH